MSYAAPAQVLMYFAPAPTACAAPIYRDKCLRFSPCRAHRLHLHCGRLHCVNTSSVRGTCCCHGVHRVAPAVYVTSAPVVESTRRLQHVRCTCACRTVYCVPAPVSYATYCDCNRWLRFWLYVLPRGPFRAVPPHSGTPFVISMSDNEGTGSVAAAIWSPLAPCGVHQPRWFQLDLPPSALHVWSGVKNSSLSVASTKSRPSSLQSVFVRGPTSFAVPFGYTSLITMLPWPALSPDAQKAAL